ncbi:hypothetical protein [Iodobacter fluviatilis]|uniref:Uncharacterized protein n=1 Tax=Iodobacter fluviatilis TaxID=537 RepID=A0A377Q3Z5_9NEIS|nr:hypothetical protein [Iodobacter fluviatilis]TCU84530.1 hypothetical protein EV682_10955 [Iodobacter fluviatilis]STQ89996.1 Uncharacterised protein [Iodobacter fluviatilis]
MIDAFQTNHAAALDRLAAETTTSEIQEKLASIEVTAELKQLLNDISELRSLAIRSDDPREAQRARAQLTEAHSALVNYLSRAIERVESACI